ncbi:hypothetical protein CAPTEDRAFT_185450 [Capitella teleta]|uniref:VWFA domain-containing protein n=1 Tax=Capitella teleta TaxID=283909 RepID=R7TGM2_CAPTE|nr:hypothetical protein CAPTEDRAFT_185450 [Capitella teleta]|eukprot:ELT92647.1 hypothetical protein CAPTEDRAFT_185450 [Capitella teleta]
MAVNFKLQQILRMHPDFSVFNKPMAVSNTTPQFRFIHTQKNGIRIILVPGIFPVACGTKIDAYGCRSHFIRSVALENIKVGIVLFSSTAYLTRNLTLLDDANREDFVKDLPTSVGGAISIGAGTANDTLHLRLPTCIVYQGVQSALEVLETNRGTDGGHIVIVSDGEETCAPYISETSGMM